MGKINKIEGGQFFRFFGSLLDALRGLGGSGTPDVVVSPPQDARVAADASPSLGVFHNLTKLFRIFDSLLMYRSGM